ncbi:MAG TPA: LamG domain-containing protein [Halanaerobiales bacterium]|nr:LamG domain-containing protein [Halanaerobiales bacterium]
MQRFTTLLLGLLILLTVLFGPVISETNAEEVDIKKGLVSYLKLNDTSSKIIDTVGQIQSENNGATFREDNIQFDGEDDFINLTNFNLKNLGQGSISLWFKVEDIPTQDAIRPILYYGAKDPCTNMPDASNQGLIIEVAHDPMHFQSKNLYFTIFADGCEYPSFCFDSREPMQEKTWYHFVAVVGEDFNTGYLNGQEITNRRYNFGNARDSEFFEDAVKDEAFWIGKGYWDAKPMYFKGNIKNIRIYNRSLNKDEVQYIYQNDL